MSARTNISLCMSVFVNAFVHAIWLSYDCLCVYVFVYSGVCEYTCCSYACVVAYMFVRVRDCSSMCVHVQVLDFTRMCSYICLFMKFCWWASSTVKSIRHCKLQYFTCSDYLIAVVVLGLLFWRSTPNPSSWVDSLWQNAYSARNQRSVSLMVLQQYYLWPIFYS